MIDFKETIKWTKEGEYYCGKLPALPCIAGYGYTLEEMTASIKVAFEIWLADTKEILAQEEPFELVEMTEKEIQDHYLENEN